MKITKNKQLVIFFGGLEIEYKKASSKSYNTIKEEIEEIRTELIKGLNNSREVSYVSDLYDENPLDIYFNPIYFRVHLPLSLQNSSFSKKDNPSLIEDFECVYDGTVLYIGAICELDKEPCGITSVRDHVTDVFNTIIKAEINPPCVYSTPISSIDDSSLFNFLDENDSKDLFKKVLLALSYELDEFFGICSTSRELEDKIQVIQEKVTQLLNVMSGNNTKKLTERLKADTGKRRKDIMEILFALSEAQSTQNALETQIRDFKSFAITSPILKVIDKKSFAFYALPRFSLNYNSVLKTVELIRNELDNRSRNRYTLLSAFSGAIVGSLITLMITHFL